MTDFMQNNRIQSIRWELIKAETNNTMINYVKKYRKEWNCKKQNKTKKKQINRYKIQIYKKVECKKCEEDWGETGYRTYPAKDMEGVTLIKYISSCYFQFN